MDNDTRLVKRALLSLKNTDAYPAKAFKVGDQSLVSSEEAQSRYQATLDWIDSYGMAVISNGPYKLVRFDPPAQFAELEAFRDDSYPFKPGDFFRGSAPSIRFDRIETTGLGSDRQATVNIEITGPGNLEVRYILQNPVTGKTLARGNAHQVSATHYTLELAIENSTDIKPGLYHLFLTAFSDEVSSLAEQRIDLEPTTGATSSSITLTPTHSNIRKGNSQATVTPIKNQSRGRSCNGPPLVQRSH